MVESTCPTCASPVQGDQAYCPKCGASLAADTTGPAELPPEAPTVEPVAAPFDGADDSEPLEDPRLTLELEPPPVENPAERLPGGYVPPSPGLEPSPRLGPSAWAMSPSSIASSPRQPGPSISLQLGAKPISLAGREGAPAPEPPAESIVEGPAAPPPFAAPPPKPAATPAAPAALAAPAAPEPAQAPEVGSAPAFVRPTPPMAPSPFAAPAGPTSPFAPRPAAVTTAPPPVPASTKPARKESVQELVAFGLIAAGAFIGIASLFLPWAGVTGIGIGTESIAGSPPPPNQWGWGMPAGLPLFLLSLPVLAAAAASDRAQERLPNLALVISRVTDLILPMVLGGMYLGVVFIYMTVPASYGPGLYLGQFAVVLGAGLLIAGAIVTVFFPPDLDRDTD